MSDMPGRISVTDLHSPDETYWHDDPERSPEIDATTQGMRLGEVSLCVNRHLRAEYDSNEESLHYSAKTTISRQVTLYEQVIIVQDSRSFLRWLHTL